jgi:hypothetical protein
VSVWLLMFVLVFDFVDLHGGSGDVRLMFVVSTSAGGPAVVSSYHDSCGTMLVLFWKLKGPKSLRSNKSMVS